MSRYRCQLFFQNFKQYSPVFQLCCQRASDQIPALTSKMPWRCSLAKLFALGRLAVSILPSTHTQSSDGCSDSAEDYCTGDTKTCVAYFCNCCTSGSDGLSQEIAQSCTNPTRNYNPEQLLQCVEEAFGIDHSVFGLCSFGIHTGRNDGSDVLADSTVLSSRRRHDSSGFDIWTCNIDVRRSILSGLQ